MEICRWALEQERPSMLTSLNNLAITTKEQGRTLEVTNLMAVYPDIRTCPRVANYPMVEDLVLQSE
jgi:hypothetical protein